VKLFVRVDLDALLRGVAREGELCEIAGYGPVPVSVVEDLTQKGETFVVAILTKSKQVVGVAHLGRRPTAAQMSALEWIYPTCAAEGCAARAHLEADHRLEWARTHFTAFDYLDRLCRYHHRLKTTEGWALIDGRGKRPFVGPEDPRHPRHSEPRHSEPCHSEPRHSEPCHSEPRHSEPCHSEPRHSESCHSEPRRHSAPAGGRSEVA
jgi:hypothetical protein